VKNSIRGVTAGAMLGLAVALLGGCSSSLSETMKAGKAHLVKGELASAVISFKNAVQADPASPDARVALGDAQERSGDLTAAEQQYRRALDLGGDASDLVLRIALILLDRNDAAILIRDFGDRELPRPAADADLRGILALAQLSLGKKDAAEAELRKATTQTTAVRLARAQLALREGKIEEATSGLEGLLKDEDAPWWVMRAASRVYAAKGDAARTLSALERAYRLAGWHQGVIGEYAEYLFLSGHADDARPLRDKLRQIAPGYYRTFFLDALFLMRDEKFDEAHDAATKVLGVLPEHTLAQLIAATVELKRGELSSVEARLKKVLAKDPGSVEALRLQFNLTLRQRNLKAAAETLEKALRLAPDDRGLIVASADLAWAQADKTRALKQLARAADMKPPQVQLYTRLAEMAQALGKRDMATLAINRAMELSSGDAGAREELFRAVLRMRLADKAKTMAEAELALRPKDPEPHLWLAAVLGSEGKEDAALEQARRALDLRPDYYPALTALAKTANSPERAREYDSRLQKAVDAKGKDARVYLDRARQLRLAGAGTEEIGAILERGLAADPASLPMREASVSHWLAVGRKDKALALATEGEAAQPDNVAVTMLTASAQEAAGDLEQAAKRYGRLWSRFPDKVELGLKYAQLLVRAQQPAEAIGVLRKLIALRADEPMPYRMLAMLQLDAKQKEEALVTARILRDRPRQTAAGLILTGDLFARLNDRDPALKAYEEAGKAGAAETALVRKVEYLDRTGAQVFAAGALKEWLAAHPDSVAALSLAARRASAGKDYATAARHLEAILKLQPRNPVVLNDLAWAQAQARNPRALETATKAARLAPDNPVVLDTLAEAQALSGRRSEAKASLRRALALEPRTAVARLHLAELLAADGKKKDAAELLRDLDERSLDKESAARLAVVKQQI
jgi:putative PEP-CTERM system TPR-repeat lipoprotein